MNYNSISDILSSGIENMEIIRNNSKQDDGTDMIVGVDWFAFNGRAASNVYVSGNSWIGFGTSSEHLKINRIDGALYSLYREEGTLYGYYKFLKIRWVGYTLYSMTSSSYEISYDVILWDTGDISLHMVTIPTSNANGTYSLTEGSLTYNYSVSNSNLDVTFLRNDLGFEVVNGLINLEIPYEKRYLVRNGSTYYTINNGALTIVSASGLTSSTFLNYGFESIADISPILNLSNPELLCWREVYKPVNKGLVIKGVPTLPQMLYYPSNNVSGRNGIKKAEVVASDDVLFTVSFDGGQTWKYYNGSSWMNATSIDEGMQAEIIKNISESAWANVVTSSTMQFRSVLPNVNSKSGHIYIAYL